MKNVSIVALALAVFLGGCMPSRRDEKKLQQEQDSGAPAPQVRDEDKEKTDELERIKNTYGAYVRLEERVWEFQARQAELCFAREKYYKLDDLASGLYDILNNRQDEKLLKALGKSGVPDFTSVSEKRQQAAQEYLKRLLAGFEGRERQNCGELEEGGWDVSEKLGVVKEIEHLVQFLTPAEAGIDPIKFRSMVKTALGDAIKKTRSDDTSRAHDIEEYVMRYNFTAGDLGVSPEKLEEIVAVTKGH